MRVIILAAGYGTRLYPLTVNLPKPLLPINGKPMINFLVDKIDRLKVVMPVNGIYVVSNARFYHDFLAWQKQYSFDGNILNDGTRNPEERLGAIRDIRFAMGGQKDDWLVLGGDNLFEADLEDFVRYALTKTPYCSVGIHDVKSRDAAKHFGVVEVNRGRRITRMAEKPAEPFSTMAASCIYFFPWASVAWLDEFLSDASRTDAAGSYIAYLAAKSRVFGYELKGAWLDIGHRDSLKEAAKLFR